jgi:hypothetical protein
MNLDDEETAALTQELHDIVESDRYPFSARSRTLKAVRAKLRPEPVREPRAVGAAYGATFRSKHVAREANHE